MNFDVLCIETWEEQSRHFNSACTQLGSASSATHSNCPRLFHIADSRKFIGDILCTNIYSTRTLYGYCTVRVLLYTGTLLTKSWSNRKRVDFHWSLPINTWHMYGYTVSVSLQICSVRTIHYSFTNRGTLLKIEAQIVKLQVNTMLLLKSIISSPVTLLPRIECQSLAQTAEENTMFSWI